MFYIIDIIINIGEFFFVDLPRQASWACLSSWLANSRFWGHRRRHPGTLPFGRPVFLWPDIQWHVRGLFLSQFFEDQEWGSLCLPPQFKHLDASFFCSLHQFAPSNSSLLHGKAWILSRGACCLADRLHCEWCLAGVVEPLVGRIQVGGWARQFFGVS